MEQPVILGAVRTPIGKFQGGLSSFAATDLGAKAVAEAVRRAGIEPQQVDEIIMGNVVSAGLGQNPARQAGPRGGVPPPVSGPPTHKEWGAGPQSGGASPPGSENPRNEGGGGRGGG